MSVTFALACEPCKQGRHEDCVKSIECTCYAYTDTHVLAKWRPPEVEDLDEHDAEKDLGDGGLGSGRWLEDE